MSGLLSRALRSPSGSEWTNLHSFTASVASLSELDAETTFLDDSVHSSVNYESSHYHSHEQHSHSHEDELLFNVEDAEHQTDLLADFSSAVNGMPNGASASIRIFEEVTSATAQSRPHLSTVGAKPPLPDNWSGGSGGAVGIPLRQPSGAFCTAPMARSCPRPILMKPRNRQHSLPMEAEDLEAFVPPHELVAGSFVDSAAVTESLSRKGSAALRLRTGVLRRTGFYEGHTETLRTQPGSSFKA